MDHGLVWIQTESMEVEVDLCGDSPGECREGVFAAVHRHVAVRFLDGRDEAEGLAETLGRSAADPATLSRFRSEPSRPRRYAPSGPAANGGISAGLTLVAEDLA